MNRRDFLRSTAAITGAGMLPGLARSDDDGPRGGPVSGPQPNILFILVDELRYPSVFPKGVDSPGEYLAKFMPNVHHLWKHGVKFGNYHTAANACTPSRGVMITGLYSQQNWLITTILSTPPDPSQPPPPPTRQPVLNPAYPTFGKLLQANGYQTPYIGKWHVSVPPPGSGSLANYGFDFMTYYDPTGDNLQGTYGDETKGFHNDAYSAGQAVDWLGDRKSTDQPWCLTVSLINPHDKEFFPAGTEFKTVDEVYANPAANPLNLNPVVSGYGTTYGPTVNWEDNALKSPKSYGYPTLPPNWESRDTLASKPSTVTFIHDFQQAVWGGVTDESTQDYATIQPYPNRNPAQDLDLGIAKMPFSYWQRALDSYTQVTQIVDCQIGRVLQALRSLPESIKDNTVVIFAADHGEYAGAHGMVQGKMATVYEEAWHIPLIVFDPSGRYTGETHKIRTGLTSSVDLMNMLVGIGYKGTTDWMTGDLAQIYGARHDMLAMLKSADAPGRSYVLLATDEIVPEFYVFNRAPTHVLGLRTDENKLGVYAKWPPLRSNIIPGTEEFEFYDYSTTGGQLELANIASTAGKEKAEAGYQRLLRDLIPNELQQKLPGSLGKQQELSKIAHLLYRDFIALQPSGTWQKGGIRNLLGYGAEF